MLENDLNKQDQYSRQNNQNIQGIPDSFPDINLKKRLYEISIKLMFNTHITEKIGKASKGIGCLTNHL